MSRDGLRIKNMSERHPGMKSPVAECYYVAACVCLDRHHTSPQALEVLGPTDDTITSVDWEAPDAATKAAWANEIDTTEAGAYALVIAAVELQTGMVAVRRAEAGTGADYYIGPPGAGVHDLEDCIRLEVSGLDKGSESTIRSRLGNKIRQATRGSSDLPALAGVVGFQQKRAMISGIEIGE